MSDIENKTKIVLEPLLLDQAVTLSVEDQRQLAIWVTLKTLVAEWNTPTNPPVSDQTIRDNFKARRIIPPNFSIYIAQCGRDGWEAAYYRDVHTLGFSPEERFSRTAPNVQSVTFGIGGLLVHVRHFMIEGVSVDLKSVGEPFIFRIWPDPSATIRWPPNRRLTHYDVARLADTIGWLHSQPNVRWIP
jgi:hypothetical protein